MFPGDARTLPKLTNALRSQTRSGSGTQQKLKIFEDSCPRAAADACLHWLALTIPHCVGNIAWEGSGWQVRRHRCRTQWSMICCYNQRYRYAECIWMCAMCLALSLMFPGYYWTLPTLTQALYKETDQERQQNTAEVEDLRKQLSHSSCWSLLALACTYNSSLCGNQCMAQVRTAKRETELYGCCRCARYMKIDLDLLGFFFVRFSWWFPRKFTQTDSSIKESDQERQRNAAEVEDLRRQLSKTAAEACLPLASTCNVSLFGADCMTKMRMANRET